MTRERRLTQITRRFTRIILLVTGYWLLVTGCYADEAIPSAELINNAKQYDGKEVTYKGEVIGDIMPRRGFVWINVNDGVNAIGIWGNKDLAKDIIYTGSYKSRGDVVEVKGIFRRACLEHGGDLDIHAEEIRKIGRGAVVNERLDIAKRNQAFALLAILCIAVILSSIVRMNPLRRTSREI